MCVIRRQIASTGFVSGDRGDVTQRHMQPNSEGGTDHQRQVIGRCARAEPWRLRGGSGALQDRLLPWRHIVNTEMAEMGASI